MSFSGRRRLHRQCSLAACVRFILLLFFVCCSVVSCLNWDGQLLFSFKNSIIADPHSLLADWSYADETPCEWNGVTCAGLSKKTNESRVVGVVLTGAQLLGSVPPELGLLDHLRRLDLSHNFLNGALPATLFNASKLRVLSLADNEISGELPDVSVNSSILQVVNLSDNALTGKVPGKFIMLPNLTVLSLAGNYFYGDLPAFGFAKLQVLDLSSNIINGSLPRNLLVVGGIRYLNLSYNRLTGEIPPEFGAKLPANATIDLSFNNLTGEIPVERGLLSQKPAAFSGNPGLCGKPLRKVCSVPATLSKAPTNASMMPLPGMTNSPPAFAAILKKPNETSARAAASAAGGDGKHGPSRLRPAVIAAIAAGDFAGICLLIIVFLYVRYSKKQKKEEEAPSDLKQEQSPSSSSSSSSSGSIFCWRKKGSSGEETEDSSSSGEDERRGNETRTPRAAAKLVMVDGETELELETLLKSSAYILGAGGGSIVYKAVLADGTALAVRRIGEGSNGGVEKMKDFEAQVRSIAKLRHPNLLRLRGFYWGANEKLLIYDYAANGSLANVSYSRKTGSSPCSLSWEVRLRIARGVARGLAYLHEKKCVQGNLKPSNVLLGCDMEPLIGDFGVESLMTGDNLNKGGSARHFGSKRSTMSQSSFQEPSLVAGTSPSPSPSSSALSSQSPYQAPDYLKNLKPSSKWDVYSFGVILLELIAGRLFSESEISEWNARLVVEDRNQVLRMVDPSMIGELQGKEEALLVCFKLGFACVSVASQKRPSMKEVTQMLDKIPCASSTSASA